MEAKNKNRLVQLEPFYFVSLSLNKDIAAYDERKFNLRTEVTYEVLNLVS